MFSDPFHSGTDLANVRFFDTVQPGDNLIPLFFADKIYGHRPVSPICCGDWLSSDRPPLQAGIFLLQRPLRVIGNLGLHYQVFGTAVQCLFICGVWVLLKAMGASERRIVQALGFLIFSGFMFYNCVYVWPKLLAATFVLFTLALLLQASAESRSLTRYEALLAAASFSVAVLAHPGSLFSMPALLWLWLSNAKDTPLITYVWAGLCSLLIGLAFAAPWIAYQRFYDPPGNRLVKMHLAGVMAIDSRSTWQSIEDSYTALAPATIIQSKWRNIETLLSPHSLAGFGLGSTARSIQRDYIANAIGLLNAGWIGAALLLIRKKTRAALPRAGLLVRLVFLNFFIWCLAMFGPAQTSTALSSYADILVLSIGLLGFLLSLPQLICAVLFGLQILNFFVVWAFFKPSFVTLPDNTRAPSSVHWPFLILGVLSATALIWHFEKSFFEGHAALPPAGRQSR
jgi:hypothetical protein